MNTRYYLRLLRTFALAALTAAATTACSDDNDNPGGNEPLTPDDNGISVAFTADINPGSDTESTGAPDTRTVLEPTNNGGFTVTWKGRYDHQNDCDKINIWAVHEQGTKANNGNPVTYLPTISAVSSSLEPEQQALSLSSEGPWTFTAVYGNSEITGNMAYAELSSLTQSEPDKTDHIAAQDFSVATVTQSVTVGDMPQNIGLQFNHLLSALQLKVTNETDGALNISEIRLSVKEDQITSRKGYDVATGKWETGEGTKSNYLQLTITAPEALTNNGTASQNFHMLFFPGYNGKQMTITVITDRGEFALTKGAPGGGFAAGMNYLTNIAIKSNPSIGSGETWTEYISSKADLIAFREKVNGGTNNYYKKTVRLTADIDLGNDSWTPIGNSTNAFRGTFEGGGHHISGLNVNIGTDYAGLFGFSYGTVRNLRVSGNVTTTGNNAGGIVGQVNSSTVENCIFSGTVNGKQNVGGIAGYNNGNSRITGCHTKDKVTATLNTVGGIAGWNNANCVIESCYSEAEVKSAYSVAGGIVGNNTGTISHCYATGAISGTANVGGIAGNNSGGTVKGGIALNPSLTRTDGALGTFGRILGNANGTIDNCAAFDGMKFTDGTSDIADRTGADGTGISAAESLNQATYTSRGFTEATATTPGWAFDTKATWTYLPWNKAFESFKNITSSNYKIAVP